MASRQIWVQQNQTSYLPGTYVLQLFNLSRILLQLGFSILERSASLFAIFALRFFINNCRYQAEFLNDVSPKKEAVLERGRKRELKAS